MLPFKHPPRLNFSRFFENDFYLLVSSVSPSRLWQTPIKVDKNSLIHVLQSLSFFSVTDCGSKAYIRFVGYYFMPVGSHSISTKSFGRKIANPLKFIDVNITVQWLNAIEMYPQVSREFFFNTWAGHATMVAWSLSLRFRLCYVFPCPLKAFFYIFLSSSSSYWIGPLQPCLVKIFRRKCNQFPTRVND